MLIIILINIFGSANEYIYPDFFFKRRSGWIVNTIVGNTASIIKIINAISSFHKDVIAKYLSFQQSETSVFQNCLRYLTL